MSRITDLLTIEYVALTHCTEQECQKCSARARWTRRKGWRTSKSPIRKNKHGRK